MARGETRQGSIEIGRGTFWAILIVVGLMIVAGVAIFGFGLLSSSTADFRGGVDQRNQTNGSGQYRIAQYDAFFRDCNSAVALQAQVDQDATGNGLPQQIAATNLAADQQQYREVVAGYNSRAQATATSGQFQASNLPYQLPVTYSPNGAHISCAG
jgi:hypothetical protein